MIRVTINRPHYTALLAHLLGDLTREQAAFLPAGYVVDGKHVTLLVRDLIPVPADAFLKQSAGYLEIAPEFLGPIVKRCREEGLALVDAHTHPFSIRNTTFSGIDDAGDARLVPKILARLRAPFYGSLVFSQSGVDGRLFHRDADDPRPVDYIRIVGTPLEDVPTFSGGGPQLGDLAEMQRRQILALGEAGQRRVAALRAGIVGAGGIGSHVAQQLAHLGVSTVLVCDPDRVEESNRGRIVGSEPDDAAERRLKVEVMERLVRRVNPATTVVPLPYPVDDERAWRALRTADVIAVCTDTVASRDFLAKLASRYVIPLVDAGTEIQVTSAGAIRTAAGRVTLTLPSEACLHGAGVLNRPDQAAGGAYGTPLADPAVISTNGVVASLAATSVLTLVTGFESRKAHHINQEYLVLYGKVQHTDFPDQVCSECHAVHARGDVGLRCGTCQ